MKEELWLIWQEPKFNIKYKIGNLIKIDDVYRFTYDKSEVENAKAAGFRSFPGFNDLNGMYESHKLFTNISTRLPNKSRPDYLDILNFYNLRKDSNDFNVLKATRGRTLTDNYEFVPAFDSSKIEFDVAGTGHCKDIKACMNYLKINKKLYLEPEPDNAYDKNAIKVLFKENDKVYHLGYVPRYYSKELLEKLNQGIGYSAMIQSLDLESQLTDENITANVKLILDV